MRWEVFNRAAQAPIRFCERLMPTATRWRRLLGATLEVLFMLLLVFLGIHREWVKLALVSVEFAKQKLKE